MGISSWHRTIPAERIKFACLSTVARFILPFAPGTASIAFWPSSATNIGARPDEPATVDIPTVSTPARFQILNEGRAVASSPTFATVFSGITEPRCRDGLIRTLATRRGLKPCPDERLSDRRNARRAGHQIHSDAADDHDWFARVSHEGFSIERSQRHSAESS